MTTSNVKSADKKRTKDNVHGEGNYQAARDFDEAERQFVQSGRVDAAARAAAPKSEAERKEMLEAEQEGKSRAKEEDPALLKPAPQQSTDGGAPNDRSQKRG